MTDSHAIAYAYLRSHVSCWHERLARWIAFHLPSKIVYWCVIRAGVHATSGQWSEQVVPDLRLPDILTRWGQAQAPLAPSKPITPAPAHLTFHDPLFVNPVLPVEEHELHRMADDGCPHE